MKLLNNSKIGLVLTGGGAKGAYQIGVLKYLAEINFEPEIITATSIGALHGGILCSYSSLKEGVNHLEQIWHQLEDIELIKPNHSAVIKTLSYGVKTLNPHFTEWTMNLLENLGVIKNHNSIFDPEPLETLVRENINFDKILSSNRELWVKVFPAWKIPGVDYDLIFNLIDLFRAKTGVKSEWLKLQDCQDIDTIYNLLLASAAIPLAFPQKSVNGKFYSDGSLDGEIPIKPLIDRGCTHIIIVHLSNGAKFDRSNYPQQTIIEIRPEEIINSFNTAIVGDLNSLFDFSSNRINSLKQRGYQDAKNNLEKIINTLNIQYQQKKAEDLMINSTLKLLNDLPL